MTLLRFNCRTVLVLQSMSSVRKGLSLMPVLMRGCKYTTSAVSKSLPKYILKESVESFNSCRGDSIVFRHWCNKSNQESDNRATIVISHGYASHSGRWTDRADEWVKKNFVVSCNDHVGHGLSSGPRAQVLDYSWFTDDLLQHTLIMKERNPNVPVFGFGQSMGAMIMLKLAMEHPGLFEGVILSGVSLVVDRKIATPTMMFFARLLHKFYPNFGLFDWDKVSGENAVDSYTNDGLCYQGKFKAGIAYASYLCILDCIEKMEKLTTPLLIIHGREDRISPLRGAEELMRRAQSRDKEMKVYEGPHSLFMNPRHARNILDDSTVWIENRL